MRFHKGYSNDAGIDITLNNDIVLKSKQFTVVDLDVVITPNVGQMAVIVPRSSAALKGLFIANAPIDAEYIGNAHAIVFNASDVDVKYNKGESFCQVLFLDVSKPTVNYIVKKEGKRDYGNFGSTK